MSQLEPLERPQLVAYSSEALGLLDLTPEQVVNSRGERWELQLKGAGPTPFSRGSDGRKVLRSSIREFLASEAMFHLGIPTTRAATCVTSDTRIVRDPLYNGEQHHLLSVGLWFGHFSGQLGDGAAMYLGEVVNSRGERWELQLKGAGPTPFSRGSDGRKVLRSSIREFLASEAMFHLGIPTTRAATCVTSDTRIVRDPLYNGNAIRERATVVSRVAPTFLRFGSFQIFLERDDIT
ncbi:uncharacterized protein HaLaN_04255, partial [Haematococcus lacustris]